MSIHNEEYPSFSSTFDVVAAISFWLIMFFGADYPPKLVTRLLPDTSPNEHSKLGIFLLIPLIICSCLSEIAFRTYVYFKMTNLSKVLICTSSIAIIVLTYIFGSALAILVNFFQFDPTTALISFTFSLLLRSFFVPANILLSQDGIIQIFIENLNDLEENSKDFIGAKIIYHSVR